MKTKINLSFLVLATLFVLNFNATAQTITFTNKLKCQVTVNYEEWDSVCSICSFSTVVVPACSSQVVNICGVNFGICIVITDIGGVTPAGNHYGSSTCHLVSPSIGQTGVLSSNCQSCANSTSPNWSTTITPNSWLIQ